MKLAPFWASMTPSPTPSAIYFKRRVYVRALHELGQHLYPDGLPPQPRWWPKRWTAVFAKDAAETKSGLPDIETD